MPLQCNFTNKWSSCRWPSPCISPCSGARTRWGPAACGSPPASCAGDLTSAWEACSSTKSPSLSPAFLGPGHAHAPPSYGHGLWSFVAVMQVSGKKGGLSRFPFARRSPSHPVFARNCGRICWYSASLRFFLGKGGGKHLFPSSRFSPALICLSMKKKSPLL